MTRTLASVGEGNTGITVNRVEEHHVRDTPACARSYERSKDEFVDSKPAIFPKTLLLTGRA